MLEAPEEYEAFLDYMNLHKIDTTAEEQPTTTMITG